MRVFHAWAVIWLAAALLPGAMASPARAQETIIINGSTPRRHTPPRADRDTVVIDIKGGTEEGPPGGPPGDICLGDRRYYCSHVGRTAYHAGAETPLGRIVGVAWKHKGDVIGAYREGPAEGEGTVSNPAAARDGFFYIIEDEAGGGIFLIESQAVDPVLR